MPLVGAWTHLELLGCPYDMSAGFPQRDHPREGTMVPKISLDHEIKITSRIYDDHRGSLVIQS